MKNQIEHQFQELGLVPVVVIDRASDVIPLGEVLLEAGLPCAEVTFRTAAAEEALGLFHSRFPEILLGAGTVLTEDQARAAIAAGAQFIVSPGFNARVVDFCLQQALAVFPGVATPTDIEAALSRGLSILKFFPAEAIGGIPYLKAIAGPYRQIRFIPSGGINPGNLAAYLSLPNVIACNASWPVSSKYIKSGNFKEIRNQVREALRIVRSQRSQIQV